jgi:tyrosine-protein kinase Etk/Wzc
LVGVICRNWLLLLLCIIIASVIAVFYLTISSRTYIASTKILLNIEERMNTGESGEYFNVSELMFQNRSLQNELAYLQSTPLIKEVVDQMNIETSYYMQEGRIPIPRNFVFTLTDIYKQSPFIVVMDENHVQPLNAMIYIGIRDDETFSIASFNEETFIYDFKAEEVERSGVYFSLNGIYHFGQTVQNDHCSFKILLNSNYNPEQYLGKELFFKFNSNASLADQFRRNLIVQTNERESAIVDLSFQWSNPTIATDFLSNLVDKYIERNLRDKNRLANSTIEYIDEQLSNISGSLGRSEQQLQNFRSSYDVMSIDDKTRNLTEQISELESRRANTESTYQSLLQVRDYFEEN